MAFQAQEALECGQEEEAKLLLHSALTLTRMASDETRALRKLSAHLSRSGPLSDFARADLLARRPLPVGKARSVTRLPPSRPEMEIAAVFVDVRGAALSYNAQARALLRLQEPGTACGIPRPAIWDSKGRPVEPADYPSNRAVRSGSPVFVNPLWFGLPDGTRQRISVFATPMQDATGEISGAVAFLRQVPAR